VPDDEVALSLRVTVEEWLETRNEFIKRGLLNSDYQITGWGKRQYISDIQDPTAADRQKRYRERVRNERNATVTSRLPEADTDTDTEKKRVRERVHAPDLEPKKIKTSRATRLPDDWELPQEWGDWAESKGLTGDEIIAQAEKFKARQKSKGASYIDWESTWHTWILNYLEWSTKNVQAKR
jgi:hypothetical protein